MNFYPQSMSQIEACQRPERWKEAKVQVSVQNKTFFKNIFESLFLVDKLQIHLRKYPYIHSKLKYNYQITHNNVNF